MSPQRAATREAPLRPGAWLYPSSATGTARSLPAEQPKRRGRSPEGELTATTGAPSHPSAPVPARPPALTLHRAGESHHPPPAPRCQGNLPSSRPARGARGRGRGAAPGPRRAGASSTAGPRARSPRGRRAPVTASRGARSPGVGAAGQTPPPRGAAPDARRAAPPSLPPAPSLRSPRRQTNGMRGAGKRPRPGRRLRRPRAPSLTLEEGDARGAAGRPPGRGGAARWAPRARAPAPEAPRRLPAAGRRARGGAGGAGGGRGRWGTSGSCGGHGVKCKLTMGWPGRPGRAGRLSPGLALSGEGWTWGRLPSDAFPGPRAPCSNPRRPLSPAIWSAPGCPACVSSLAGDTALRAIKPRSDLLSLNPLLLADFQTDYLLSH